MSDTILILKHEYDELTEMKKHYHELIKYNTIALSNNTIFCRLCKQISKQEDVRCRTLYDSDWFNKNNN